MKMNQEKQSLPAGPPENFSAFLEDMQRRWSLEDKKRAISLIIGIFEGISNAQVGSSLDSRSNNQRNASAFFVELVAISAQYYQLNPASLSDPLQKLLNVKLEIVPLAGEQFESVEAGAPPIVATLQNLRLIQTRLSHASTASTATMQYSFRNLLYELLRSLRIRS